MKTIYINHALEDWKKRIESDYRRLEQCQIRVISNGYILPYKRIPLTRERVSRDVYAGGVLDSNGKFITGTERRKGDGVMAYECKEAYDFLPEEVIESDETVIFGGEIIKAFGHCITDSLTRLWFLAENPQRYKIVFCKDIQKPIPETFNLVMKSLGIEDNQWEVCENITRYANVIVPDQGWLLYYGYSDKIAKLYDKISCNMIATQHFSKKIYLSRTRFEKKDCFGEMYFENFYKKLGYEILYPEQLLLKDQIAAIRNATDVACTAGTLSHLLLFAKEKTKATILIRCNEPGALTPQFMINQMKKIDCTWVNISNNFLPTTHAGGVFLITSTDEWKEYVNDLGVLDMVEYDIEKELLPYLIKWTQVYSAGGAVWKKIKDMDMFDVLNNFSYELLGIELERKKMKSVKQLSNTQSGSDNQVTRAELMEALYSLEGRPNVNYKSVYKDVPQKYEHAKAIVWAYENGVAGHTDFFQPNNAFTKEKCITFLYRYSMKHNYLTFIEENVLTDYSDKGKVSDYAMKPMKWAVTNGIIIGSCSRGIKSLNPQGIMNYTQMVKVICIMMNKIISSK
ncbi:MAG: glycosyltransferase family 61 protein [Lachnospiraceae bacterium]|nr:glycosyltransferase family 61 protein [Lachnospiraceae bacterium]